MPLPGLGLLPPWLNTECPKLLGNFQSRNGKRDISYYSLGNYIKTLIRTIRRQMGSILCVNETMSVRDKERIRQELQEAFQQILSKRSSFER